MVLYMGIELTINLLMLWTEHLRPYNDVLFLKVTIRYQYLLANGFFTHCIIRRDCHEEVYAGSHAYPGQGVYLLKFDNTYSLWRSKTLYYRVYYTR